MTAEAIVKWVKMKTGHNSEKVGCIDMGKKAGDGKLNLLYFGELSG